MVNSDINFILFCIIFFNILIFVYIALNTDKHTIEEEKEGIEEEANIFCAHEREIDENANELVNDDKGILILSFGSRYCILHFLNNTILYEKIKK